MKITENKTTVLLIERLAATIEARRKLDEEEKQIKDALKVIMKSLETNVLATDKFVAILSNRFRTELDKHRLKITLGSDYDLYMRKSEYQTLEIKKA